MTEFPCNFPCPWRNKTFIVYRNGTSTINLEFGSDGQSINVAGGQPSQCYQITEHYLIFKYVNVKYFMSLNHVNVVNKFKSSLLS